MSTARALVAGFSDERRSNGSGVSGLAVLAAGSLLVRGAGVAHFSVQDLRKS